MDIIALLLYFIPIVQVIRLNSGLAVAYKTKDGEYHGFHPNSKFAYYVLRIEVIALLATFGAAIFYCVTYLSESQCIRDEDDGRGYDYAFVDDLDDSFLPTFVVLVLKYGLILYYGFFLTLGVLFCGVPLNKAFEALEGWTGM